jgi:hypothetical protein
MAVPETYDTFILRIRTLEVRYSLVVSATAVSRPHGPIQVEQSAINIESGDMVILELGRESMQYFSDSKLDIFMLRIYDSCFSAWRRRVVHQPFRLGGSAIACFDRA